MTPQEASDVARIACIADDGCGPCARNLLSELADRFPEHAAIFEAAWDQWDEDGRPGIMGDDLTFRVVG